jgi:hypothetical protein
MCCIRNFSSFREAGQKQMSLLNRRAPLRNESVFKSTDYIFSIHFLLLILLILQKLYFYIKRPKLRKNEEVLQKLRKYP